MDPNPTSQFLDTEPTQVLLGHVVIHDKLTDRVALQAMRPSES